ncbi:aromatic acid exporter family protein [Marinicrinis sediminis]|uniref:Aromatic acid exporter family protein n=1 Tax=Marinicrinis sediminis TaxID=1652465 RepID=A0ABW5RCW3_9BACL
MKLGGRILKTGLAVVLTLYICQWFALSPSIIMVIAAVLTTQPTIYRSYRYFLEQLQANTIGALLGLMMVYVLGNEPIVIGLAVILVIMTNLLLKLDTTISLSILTVIAVMEQPDEVLNRFMLIMLGILLSLIINAILLPPNYEKTLKGKLKDLSEELSLLLRNMVEGVFDEKSLRAEKEKLEKDLKKADELYEMLKEESGLTRLKKKNQLQKTVIHKHFLESLKLMMKGLNVFRREGELEMEREIQENILALTQYFELIFMKYEGKVKVKQAHARNPKVAQENTELIEQLIHLDLDQEGRVRYIGVVSALIELSEQLNHLDQLVTSYRLHHSEKKEAAAD